MFARASVFFSFSLFSGLETSDRSEDFFDVLVLYEMLKKNPLKIEIMPLLSVEALLVMLRAKLVISSQEIVFGINIPKKAYLGSILPGTITAFTKHSLFTCLLITLLTC